jgi:ATP-dependent RNA helicase DeaD
MYRSGLPVAEGLRDLGRPPLADRARPSHSDRRSERAGHQASDSRPSRERAPRQDREHRPRRDEDGQRPTRSSHRDTPARDETVWFGLNIGRDKNADVRWLLPLICRVGDVTKREIGAIKVGDSETRFEILAEHADNFANAVKTSKHKEGRIWRIEDGEDTSYTPTHRPYAERPREQDTRRPKPYARAQRDEHNKPAGKYRRDREGATAGGNATLKRSWKEKQRS